MITTPTRLALALAAGALAAGSQARAEEPGECGVVVVHGKAVPGEECEAAIDAPAAPEDKAALLYRLAYELNEHDGALEALPLLDRAVALQPDNLLYRHERGYTRADLGYYREALDDLDRVLAREPDRVLSLTERAWVRYWLGDFTGALADIDRAIAVGGEKPPLVRDLADNLVRLGRLDEAEAELAKLAGNADEAENVADFREQIARIRAFRPATEGAEPCELQELSSAERASRLYDVCTRAFLDNSEPGRRADFLTVRAVAAQVMSNEDDAGMLDMAIAAGLDPETPYRQFNYGSFLLKINHSWAARNAFNEALAASALAPRDRAMTLAGRAQANYNLGEPDAAFTDAKASFEIEPTHGALIVLGDLALDRDDRDSARLYYMGAYRMGLRDDYLIGQLREAGVDDPAAVAADDAS